eukprot:scaffold73166_cov65-Phaeocystis_antarctica.AAC.4
MGRRGGDGRRGGSGWCGGGGLRGLSLCLQRRQRLADLPGARSQVWLLLPQLGEQRLGAELGVSQPQSADGLKEAVDHATVASGDSAGPTTKSKFGEAFGGRRIPIIVTR